jgi:hypothetical protein
VRSLSLSTSTRPISNKVLFGETICLTPSGTGPASPPERNRAKRRKGHADSTNAQSVEELGDVIQKTTEVFGFMYFVPLVFPSIPLAA